MASIKPAKPKKTQEELDAELEQRLRAQAISKGVRENPEKETESMVDMVKGGWEKLKGGLKKAFDEPDYAPQTERIKKEAARKQRNLGVPGMTDEEVTERLRQEQYMKENPEEAEAYSRAGMEDVIESRVKRNKKNSLQRISQPFQKGR